MSSTDSLDLQKIETKLAVVERELAEQQKHCYLMCRLPLIRANCSDAVLDFIQNIKDTSAFSEKHVKGRYPAFDDVIHRVSMILTPTKAYQI